MAKPIIQSDKFVQNLTKMVDTLAERADVFQQYMVREVASGVQEEIRARAPNDKDLPTDYKRELEVVRVDGRDASYAIVYRGRPESAKNLDPEKTVLYITILNTSDRSPEATLFLELSRFQPFTMDTMPLEVPRDTAFVVARVVTRAETDLVRKRVQRQKSKIQRVVDKFGRDVRSKRAFDINSAELFNDLAFQVLRKEFGIGLSKKPHWRPSLRFVAMDDAFVKKLSTSHDSQKLWNDPNWVGWRKLGKVKSTVPESSVEDLDDFQKKIIAKGVT